MPSPEDARGAVRGWLDDLADIAAAALVAAVHDQPAPTPSRATARGRLADPGACFVTLHRTGRLRGCIGTLEARRPLLDDVIANARAAALDDPRFPAVATAEIDVLEVDVSVLSPAEPLEFDDHADLLRRLRPGTDGIILAHRGRRATFLPSVWAQLPDPASFLLHLRHKAGIEDRVPTAAIAVERYTTAHSPAVAPRAAAARARTAGLID